MLNEILKGGCIKQEHTPLVIPDGVAIKLKKVIKWARDNNIPKEEIPNEVEYLYEHDLYNTDMIDLTGTTITDLSILENLVDLQVLYISNSNVDISTISKLTSITELYLDGMSELTDITPLANLTNLEAIILNNTKVKDISILKNMTNLKHLEVQNTLVTDISCLKELSDIVYVNLKGTKVEDISYIKETPSVIIQI